MPEHVLLTPRQVDEIRNLCTGLHTEIGTASLGSEYYLTCFDRTRTQRVLTKMGKTILHFPTDDAADQWNKVWETRIRYTGHVGTIALGIVVTLLTKKPLTGIGAGSAAGIGKDEVQARWPYPYARRNWRIEVRRNFAYKQDALSQDRLSFAIWMVGYNHLGENQYTMGPLRYTFEIGEEHGRIPRDVALSLVEEAGTTTTKTINDISLGLLPPGWF